MATDLHDVRTDYKGRPLPADLKTVDPWALFERWLHEAVDAELPEPNAFTLSTVDGANRPHARVVLLKEFTEEGLVFFTHYDSEKGRQLSERPDAHALFWWPAPMRQVRVAGAVERLERSSSETYFHSRPRASQISASVSRQSQPISSRAELDQKIMIATQRLGEDPVPMPETWGGYVLHVDRFEFWQGLPGRVHDRARFTRTADGWTSTRLQP